MGGEFGQWNEWSHEASLDWQLLDHPFHVGLRRWVADLNGFYRNQSAMYERDCEAGGFEWVDCHDSDNSTLSFMRWGKDPQDVILVICNFTPIVRFDYRLGVPYGGFWQEALNSDAEV